MEEEKRVKQKCRLAFVKSLVVNDRRDIIRYRAVGRNAH